MELTDTGATESLGRIVANFLAGSWRAIPPDPNISAEELKQIAPLLLKSGAASLCWWRIRESRLSDCDAAVELRSAYQLHSLQAAVHRTEIAEVISLLNSAGVEPVLVKGWAVAGLYPEEGLRPYGDIDLCFVPGQYRKAVAVLGGLEAGRYSVDVHEGLGKLDGLSLDELMARSEPAHLGAAKFRLLGEEDSFAFCAHTSCGMPRGGRCGFAILRRRLSRAPRTSTGNVALEAISEKRTGLRVRSV